MTIRFGSVAKSTRELPLSAALRRQLLGLRNMSLSPSSAVAITGGTIDGVPIGSVTPSSANFTVVAVSSGLTADHISGTPIGATLASSANFTAVDVSSGMTANHFNGPIGATLASSADFTSIAVSSMRYIPSSSDLGVKHGTLASTPDWGWDDWLGEVAVMSSAGSSASPTFQSWNGGIRQWQFAVGDEIFNDFHVQHDYAPGTDLFIHVHHSHNLTTITSTGEVTWAFEVSYAKGFRQMAFGTPVTMTVTTNASTVQLMHLISEVQLSGAAGSTAMLATTDIEVDGVIMVRTWLSANTMNGGALPFLHHVDIHHQTRDGSGTMARNYPFYST